MPLSLARARVAPDARYCRAGAATRVPGPVRSRASRSPGRGPARGLGEGGCDAQEAESAAGARFDRMHALGRSEFHTRARRPSWMHAVT
jgi:hypothetical protein